MLRALPKKLRNVRQARSVAPANMNKARREGYSQQALLFQRQRLARGKIKYLRVCFANLICFFFVKRHSVFCEKRIQLT